MTSVQSRARLASGLEQLQFSFDMRCLYSLGLIWHLDMNRFIFQCIDNKIVIEYVFSAISIVGGACFLLDVGIKTYLGSSKAPVNVESTISFY